MAAGKKTGSAAGKMVILGDGRGNAGLPAAWVPETDVENLIDHRSGGVLPLGEPSPVLSWLATARAANSKDKRRVFLH